MGKKREKGEGEDKVYLVEKYIHPWIEDEQAFCSNEGTLFSFFCKPNSAYWRQWRDEMIGHTLIDLDFQI